MFKVLLKIAVVIFLAEAFIMIGLEEFEHDFPPVILIILDASLLALFALGPIYFWVIKPYVDYADSVSKTLKHNASELSAIVEAVVEGIVTIDAKGIIHTVNTAAENLFGYAHGEMIGQNVNILMTGADRVHHDKYLTEHAKAIEARILGSGRKLEGRRKDKTIFPLQISIAEMAVSGGRMYTGIMRDLTAENEFTEKLKQQVVELEFQRQNIEEAAQERVAFMEELTFTKEEVTEKNNFLHEIMENTGQGVLVFNSQLLLAAWNNTFQEMMNLQENEYSEYMTLEDFLKIDSKRSFLGKLTPQKYIAQTKKRIEKRSECHEYSHDQALDGGKVINVEQRIMDDGSILTMFRDVTLERYEEDRIKIMALRDGLTGLANRRSFDAQIEDALKMYYAHETPFLLAFIDLDDFKTVNDTHGHGAGDAVLKYVANCLEKHIRETDVAIRLGGDEFAIIFHETNDEELVVQRLNKIIKEIKDIDELAGYSINIGASAGLARCPQDGVDALSLMETADKALYSAKDMGKGQVYCLGLAPYFTSPSALSSIKIKD